jgi:hypothetical protein
MPQVYRRRCVFSRLFLFNLVIAVEVPLHSVIGCRIENPVAKLHTIVLVYILKPTVVLKMTVIARSNNDAVIRDPQTISGTVIKA